MMYKKFIPVLICCSLLLLAQFASATKIKSSHKNPEATAASLEFTKVLVAVNIKQEMTRKVAEDKAVRIINAGGRSHAIPSYIVLTPEEMDNKEQAKAKVESMGFDGALVMRYAGSEDQKKYEEDDPVWVNYDYWNGYWCPACGSVYNATESNDLTVYIETMLFSLKENKLIWAGITETKNPKNPAKVVGEIAEEVTKHLQKEGLIPKKK